MRKLSSILLMLLFCVIGSDLYSSCLVSVNAIQVQEHSRISGKDRYETSLRVSETLKSEVAVIASGNSFADALSSVNISNKFGGIIVLSDGKTNINRNLHDRGVKKVYLVGGENTIPNRYQDNLSTEFEVIRVAGNDRYLTSEESIKITGYDKVGIADGQNYPDALSATPLLKQDNYGLLLVDGSKDYTVDEKIQIVYTFGGKKSVLKDSGERIYGNSRYETAINIMRKIENPEYMAFVSGKNYADALSSTNLLLIGKTVIMPVDNNISTEVLEYLKYVKKVFFIGGESSISRSTENIILRKNKAVKITNEGVVDGYDIEDGSRNIIIQIRDIEERYINLKSIKDTNESNIKSEDIKRSIEKLKKDYSIFLNNVNAKIENFDEDRDEYKKLLSELEKNFQSFLDKLVL